MRGRSVCAGLVSFAEACVWRGELIQDVATGLFGRLAQDHTDLVFHGSTMPRRAQAQQRLELVIELSDGEAGHRVFSLAASNIQPN